MLTEQVETNKEGWLWPKGDAHTWPTVVQELDEIPVLASLCPEKRVCVQAGGNGGLWPDKLAQVFEVVYTFEPDPILFRCLVHNNPHENIIFTQSALGHDAGFISMDRWMGPINPGANRIKGGGAIPMMALDRLELSIVDLLQLDIEGAELMALKGAEQTINRCRPVISLELRNHSHHFGTTDDEIRLWLKAHGYELDQRMNYDEFWLPKERA
jgi:FkbM family methyltransferase